jgi:hypothetical protein
MSLFDTVTVEVLAADFQTKQLGEGMLTYRLTAAGEMMAPCGVVIACHGLVPLLGDDGAEFMAIFTHGAPGVPGPDCRRNLRRLPLPGPRVALDARFLVT